MMLLPLYCPSLSQGVCIIIAIWCYSHYIAQVFPRGLYHYGNMMLIPLYCPSISQGPVSLLQYNVTPTILPKSLPGTCITIVIWCYSHLIAQVFARGLYHYCNMMLLPLYCQSLSQGVCITVAIWCYSHHIAQVFPRGSVSLVQYDVTPTLLPKSFPGACIIIATCYSHYIAQVFRRGLYHYCNMMLLPL